MTIHKALPLGRGGTQPDWNQNDDTQPDYVKNRPFYTGNVETVLVEEITVTFEDDYSGFQSTFEATVGETYKVYWDGTAYECTCTNHNDKLFIGNLSIIGAGSDTGEPFIMMVVNGRGIEIAKTDPSASHTISISGIVTGIIKIDEKYLPENIATKLEVEAAQTAADNAQATADAAFAKFPIKYSDVVDTPLSAIEFSGEVTRYSRSSVNSGTFINLVLYSSDIGKSGFYKVSSDVFHFEDIYKIVYEYQYSSGSSSAITSVDDLEPKVIFSSDHSVFVIDREILFCGSTGTFTITVGKTTYSFNVAETGIYSATHYKSSSDSFVNYIEVTKKESAFIQSGKPVLIRSSTEGSNKKFKITVDDSGTISATEVP